MSDTSKPRLSLVPLRGLARIAIVMASGLRPGRKPWGWVDETAPPDLRDALLRHVVAYIDGDQSEDHLAAIGANVLMLLWFDEC